VLPHVRHGHIHEHAGERASPPTGRADRDIEQRLICGFYRGYGRRPVALELLDQFGY
jgi:hypothetical protein